MPHAIRDGILAVLFVSGPIVLLAASLGLAIGVVQAATQIQEQTLGSAIKIVGVFMALIIGGVWMFTYLNRFASTTFNKAFRMVPSLSAHPLPPLFRFRAAGTSNKLKEKGIEFDNNLPYEFRPPTVQDPMTFNRAPSGRASALSEADKRADIEPINQGETLATQTRNIIPPRPQTVNIAGQELRPVNLAPVIPQPTIIPANASPASEPAPPEIPAEPLRVPETTRTASRPAPTRAIPPRTQTTTRAPAPAAPRETVPPAPRKRLERSRVGNITGRIQNSLNEIKEAR